MSKTHLEYMEAKCREIGTIIAGVVPKDVGFTICLAHFGEGGFATYLSNQNRKDTVKLLREIATIVERKEDMVVEPYPDET